MATRKINRVTKTKTSVYNQYKDRALKETYVWKDKWTITGEEEKRERQRKRREELRLLFTEKRRIAKIVSQKRLIADKNPNRQYREANAGDLKNLAKLYSKVAISVKDGNYLKMQLEDKEFQDFCCSLVKNRLILKGEDSFGKPIKPKVEMHAGYISNKPYYLETAMKAYGFSKQETLDLFQHNLFRSGAFFMTMKVESKVNDFFVTGESIYVKEYYDKQVYQFSQSEAGVVGEMYFARLDKDLATLADNWKLRLVI